MFTFLENPIQIPPGGIDSSNAVSCSNSNFLTSSSVIGTMHQDDLMDDPVITGKHQVLTIQCQDICKYANNIEQWDYYSGPVGGEYPVPSDDDDDDNDKPVDDKPGD